MYTKLFGEIIHSTIWVEPLETKIVWITMMAMTNDRSEVRASVPGLARAAGVTTKQCEVALECFMSPDKHSRSQEYEGRRVEECDGGWLMLNHDKYRNIRSTEDRNEYQRKYMAKKRAASKEGKPKKKTKTKKEFKPPTVEEVAAHCLLRGNSIKAEAFVAFYESKGWKVGNTPMKDWKACIVTWEQRDGGKESLKDQHFI